MNLSEQISAASRLNSHVAGDRVFGDVATALITDTGNVHYGVCIDAV